MPFIQRLYEKWNEQELWLVRSISGSPSLMFLETAKGCGTYINTWKAGKTYPFDLIPGLHLLEGSGGYILNKSGNRIDPWNHSGYFLAGLDKNFLHQVIKFISI